ncbi:MAG: hypothetical protein DWH79_04960 [Planctomycetota bacterium]|nr:MAG: hypothetical protein DWH79_04960 [Planctomycetota bacterium]
MADIVFAFDAALDRPIPLPAAAPPTVIELLARAPWEAFEAAVTTARQSRAAALVLFGSSLDPVRASPAQAARLAAMIIELAADGCQTIWISDDAADCANVARALAEPAGLSFVTPVAPQRLDIRGLSVEICSARGPAFATTGTGQLLPSFASAHSSLLPAQRRIVVGWDDAWSTLHADGTPVLHGLHAPLPGGSTPAAGTFFVWGSRRLQAVPAGVHPLPALQARAGNEAAAGACGALTLTNLGGTASLASSYHPVLPVAAPHSPATTAIHSATAAASLAADGRAAWREVATHRVAWRTLALTSLSGGDEELATAIWGALESLTPDPNGPLQIVRCAIDCGGSLTRRVHVSEISAETFARLRQLFDPQSFRMWCQDLEADRSEGVESLVRNASSSKSGATASFASLLAEQVLEAEKSGAGTAPREAAWLALELMEST